MARRLLGWAALAAMALPSSAVNKQNFRTCEQTGFCKRQRGLESGKIKYNVIQGSIVMHSNTLEADLIATPDDVNYRMVISTLAEATVRVEVEEKDQLHQRYKVRDSLVGAPKPMNFIMESKTDNGFLLKFGASKLAVTFVPLRIDFIHDEQLCAVMNSNNLLNIEHQRVAHGPNHQHEEKQGMWTETFKSWTDTKKRGPESIGFDVLFPGSSHVYGLPEHADDLALEVTTGNEPYRLYNLDVFEYETDSRMALYGAVPVAIAHNAERSVGIFFNNAAEMFVDVARVEGSNMDKGILAGVASRFLSQPPEHAEEPSISTHWMAETGSMDVFIMMGKGLKPVMAQYTALTGTQQLPPQWAIAYHQCRWNYVDEKDVATVNRRFDEEDIPYDVLWLDIEHTDEKRYFTWDKRFFPTPKRMQEELAQAKRKMVTIIDPHIRVDSNYHVYKGAMEQSNFFCKNRDENDFEGHCWPGNSKWLDFTQKKVRDYWAGLLALDKYDGSTEHLHAWNDMNEPSVFSGPEVTMDKDARHEGGVEHRDVHNIYGMYQHMATHDGLLHRSGKTSRPFVLSRAFFAGTQRYGAVWTGDNKGCWSHLKATTPMLLSLGLGGIAFCGADIGGFFNDDGTTSVDPELITRWYQASVLMPFFRAHGHIDTKRREPFVFEGNYKSIMKATIKKRYEYLPYLYTLFYESHYTGAPVMRPLVYEYPTDANTFHMDNQYLCGSDVLVKPVVEAGVGETEVYLPGKEAWYDYEAKLFRQPGKHMVLTPLEHIPMFQRAGSVVPHKQRARRSSQAMEKDPYTLVVALDSSQRAEGTLYIDDFDSYEYQDGHYALRRFVAEMHHGRLVVTSMKAPAYNTAPQQQGVAITPSIERIEVMGITHKPSMVDASNNANNGVRERVAFTFELGVLTLKRPNVTASDDFSISVHF